MVPATARSASIQSRLGELLIGQPEAIAAIVPFIEMQQAGLAIEGRPAAVFLLLGPTGTGKTRTVEALAEVLHGSARNLLKVDCGEFQTDHEYAKLIGAPPGYLGHRETQALLAQPRVNSVSSENSNLSLILFDEIEKAAPSVTTLLLGILDKATLRLGDNTTTDFQNTMIFLTSNLGARSMQTATKPNWGYESLLPLTAGTGYTKLQAIAIAAVRRKFSPEFVNRIDAVITYKPLDRASCKQILDQNLAEYARLIYNRLGQRAFQIRCSPAAHERLLDLGVSLESGARELKRTLQRSFLQPLAAMVAQGAVAAGSDVALETTGGEFSIRIR